MTRPHLPLAPALALVVAMAVGCTGPAASPHRPTVDEGSSPSDPVVALPLVTLAAGARDPVAAWQLVARLPAGDGEGQLSVGELGGGSLPRLPRSFAVAADGTIWVVDAPHRRVAHFAASGENLGDVGGFHFDLHHQEPCDVVISHGRLYVLLESDIDAGRPSAVVTVDREGSLMSGPVIVDGERVDVSYLFPTSHGVGGMVTGIADAGRVGTGPRGYYEIDPALGPPRPIPGIPVGSDRWITITLPGGGVVSVGERDRGLRSELPLSVRETAQGSRTGRTLPTIVGDARGPAPTSGALALYLLVSPARADQARRYGGGRWLLRAGEGPLLFERLPKSELDDHLQLRHIASDPMGNLYLMLVHRRSVDIFRRP